MMTSGEIREKFLRFFQSKEHVIVPSAPIVVKNDPTLMFTNAGMNQFKDYFLGNRIPEARRVADSQKCLRVSGKHNDLEEVGVDTYHHTMFEMLGNWSFGDPANPNAGYFKKEAIAWSWELLTEIYGIEKDRLYVTVFEGDESEKLPRDEEAIAEWSKWVSEEKILMGSKKDNFWEMGDTGPCGPCTEIHVDCRTDEERKKIDGSTLVNRDHPQVIEIWNNVFIQFNRLRDGSLEPLPAKHVDTGMGLERLVRVLQHKQSNYDTDVFSVTIRETEALTGKKYEGGDAKSDIAFRVIADHIRAIAFTIADGQLPSNTGAGYVIRRILRRAVRYYYSALDYHQPLLHQLLPVLGMQFKDVYPELHNQMAFVSRVVREEEEGFLRTLEKGLKLLDQAMSNATEKVISGSVAFELSDTYGFPPDLTRLIASENGFTVDEGGFESELLKQKERSRAATAVDTGDWTVIDDYALHEFVGYDSLEIKTRVIRYRKVKTKNKEAYQLVLEATPFYAESGGQVGDTGILDFAGEQIEVKDTKKENELIIHITDVLPADPKLPVFAKVDLNRRFAIMAHHTATHLLHAALRRVLGTHVVQKGSLVSEGYLRFDFAHFAKMTHDEMRAVERTVNEKIRDNITVETDIMPHDKAIARGAMALFGEKYGSTVRVVTIDPSFSIELCGGTHVNRTGDLGYFVIRQESAVAAGIRRIEALSGLAAENYLQRELDELRQVREIAKNPAGAVAAVNQLQNDRAELQKLRDQFESLRASSFLERIRKAGEKVNGVIFYHDVLPDADAGLLKKIALEMELRSKEEPAVLLLFGKGGEKISLVLASSENLKSFHSGKLLKEKLAPLLKGGGGGQPFLASGTAADASRIPQAIELIRQQLNPEA